MTFRNFISAIKNLGRSEQEEVEKPVPKESSITKQADYKDAFESAFRDRNYSKALKELERLIKFNEDQIEKGRNLKNLLPYETDAPKAVILFKLGKRPQAKASIARTRNEWANNTRVLRQFEETLRELCREHGIS